MRRLCVLLVVAAAALVLPSATAGATTWATATGVNLLPEPNAEAGLGGWSSTAGYGTALYGAAGEYLGLGVGPDGGPGADAGLRFFDPGFEPDARMWRDVDISAFAGDLASGRYDGITVGGFLGGFAGSPDTVDLRVTPLDGAGAPLAAATVIAGPTVAERGYETRIVQRGDIFRVPAATRKIRIELLATGQPGAKNHGYADELYLGMMRVPTGQPQLLDNGSGAGGDAPPISADLGGPFIQKLPVIRVARKPVRIRRDGRRLVVVARATLLCPAGGTAPVTCEASATVRARRGGRVLGAMTARWEPGERLAVRVPLNGSARRTLRRKKRIAARIVIDAIQRDASADTVTRATTLRMPTPAHARSHRR